MSHDPIKSAGFPFRVLQPPRSRRTFRHRLASVIGVLGLTTGLAACSKGSENAGDTTATSTEPSTTVAQQSDFSSTGTLRDGLYWLEDISQAARWEFPAMAVEPADLALELHVMIPIAGIAADGTGSFALRYGQGGDSLGAQDLTFNASPAGPSGSLAMLSGSTRISAADLPVQDAGLWVEVATSPLGSSAVAVESASLSVSTAPAALAANVLTAPASAPATMRRIDGEFTTDGDSIAGWYWLRDEAFAQYARWTFPPVPSLADGVTLQLYVLATDGFNGGPHFDARFYLTYGFTDAAGQPLAPPASALAPPPPELTAAGTTIPMTIRNVSPNDDPVGYTTQDTLTISADQVPAGAMGVWFEATRNDPSGAGASTTEHVAFNAASVGLLVLDGGDGTADDDPLGRDDGTLDDPDGLADADSQADADDVGDLPPGTYEGTLDGETDDWFAFQLNGTQIVDLAVAPADELFLDIELINPSGDIRAPQPEQQTDMGFSHAAARGDGGRWYIHFYRLQGSGLYQFTFAVRDANDGLLHIDAGDTLAAATVVGPGDLPGELRWDDPGDHYLIDVPAGQPLIANLESIGDASFEVELREKDDSSLLADDIAYFGEPAALLLEAADSNRTIEITLGRYSGVGGQYRLRLAVGGGGECTATPVSAATLNSSGGTTGVLSGSLPGWYWMQPDPLVARGQSSTWMFEALPDDSTVRVMIDVTLDRKTKLDDPNADDEVWPPNAAAVYLSYGLITDDGGIAVGTPRFVTLSIVPRSGSTTGFAAIGEVDIPHADLSGATDAWWIRMTLVDPAAVRPARAPAVIGVALDSIRLCAGGNVDTLDGFNGPADPADVIVTYDAATRTMTSDTTMFVEPGADVDGDGLNQKFENAAIAIANPVIELDEEELWQNWLDDHPTVNFVQATLWPSYANPRYVVLGYLNTWAYDGGGGVQPLDWTNESHRGDSERIWEAWKIVDETTITLEWVNTSAHASYSEHSGVWNVNDRQCNEGFVGAVSIGEDDKPFLSADWGFFEVMCDDLAIDDDGLVVMQTSEDKHAMYPSESLCEDVSVGADVSTGVRLWGEDCGWFQSDIPFVGWHDSDFDDDPNYQGGGRWRFDVYNVGEPGYPLIDDLDEPATWVGLTTDQVAALTGAYPTEAVWTGHDDDSRFCGGLEMGDTLPMPWYAFDKVMPNDPTNCSTKLGGKFTEWQKNFVDAMASTYRLTLETGTELGAGTDERVVIELHDADGTMLAARTYLGSLENGDTDIVYLPPYSTGGDVATVSIRRTGVSEGITSTADWYLATVTVDDLVTGQSTTYTVDQWIQSGAGITL